MTLAETSGGEVVRPLKVLISLIKRDLQEAENAAEEATRPYWAAIGEKLLEAKGQLARGQWMPWLRRNFALSQRQANVYMAACTTVSRENGSALPFSTSLRSHVQEHLNPQYGKYQSDLKKLREQARAEAFRIAEQDALTAAQERQADCQLAQRLIDIGYKVLAKELHPDRMHGDRDAMTRLNQVRKRMKQQWEVK